MDNGKMFEINREAWNEATAYHQKARKSSLQIGFANPDFTTLNRNCDEVMIEKLEKIGLEGKTIAQLPCNNGRELLSLMRFGATKVIGFDISDVAIAEAKELAEISGLNAEFERTNILDIGQEYNGYFDFIYISEGSLQWFGDLDAYFAVVSRLLKPEGIILIYEIHPLAYLLELASSDEKRIFNGVISYFEKGPYSYRDGLDYIGGTTYKAKKCYWFMHKMSDIMNAILQNSMQIEEFSEYNMEMANNPQVVGLSKLPLSYILTGKKAVYGK